MALATLTAAQPTKERLLDYQNSCALVNQYAYAITNTTIPTLTRPPDYYAQFMESFVPAKTHCNEWIQGIFPQSLTIPRIIVNQTADLFALESTMVDAYLTQLVDDPSNEKAKAGLKKALDTMRGVVKAQVDTTVSMNNSLQRFATELQSDTQILTAIAKNSLTYADQDRAKIEALTTAIGDLNKEVENLNKILTLSEIGMGVSIFVGLVGAVVCFIPGAQGVGIGLIVLAVAGEAASIAGTVIASREIDAKNALIQADRKAIDDYKQDIVALQATNSQFVWLEAARSQAETAMTEITQMWTDLDTEIDAVSSDLAEVDSAATSEQYAAAQDDLRKADDEWQQVVDFAQGLAGIDYKWQDSEGKWHSYADEAPALDGGKVDHLPSAV